MGPMSKIYHCNLLLSFSHVKLMMINWGKKKEVGAKKLGGKEKVESAAEKSLTSLLVAQELQS